MSAAGKRLLGVAVCAVVICVLIGLYIGLYLTTSPGDASAAGVTGSNGTNLYLATAGSFHSWKFLPTIGRYVVNVLDGKSNGKEKDDAWGWKRTWERRGAHEKVWPKGELGDFE